MRTYLVGGAVRDLLLGREPADEDYLVTGTDAETTLQSHPGAKAVGADTPTWVIRGREYALPRGDAVMGEASIDADLALRDLTINALAVAQDGELIAHPSALADLQARVLRPCGPTSLPDDPARVFRAARLAAQLPEFQPTDELLIAMRAAAPLTPDLPCERIAKEVRKVLAAPRPSRFLELLAATGNLAPWLAELDGSDIIPAGPAPYHTGSLLRHTGRVLDALAVTRPGDDLAGWMGLVHDLGKTATEPQRWPRHHDHDALGPQRAETLGVRLGLPRRFLRAGTVAAGEHMKAARYATLRPGTRVDLLDTLHRADLLERMFALVAADAPESGPDPRADHLLALARRDLEAMLAVQLATHERDLGAASGARLRELRCLAVAAVSK